MRVKTPTFWYDTDTPAARLKTLLASPLCLPYGVAYKLRQALARPQAADIPVICVGNLTAGGSGKTPVAQALMALLTATGLARTPCFLSRGYGGTTAPAPFYVDPARHGFGDTGDEPLLLARQAPTIVSPQRYEGALFAARHGHDALIMDDGLQNPQLRKTVRFAVIDGMSGFGNGYPLPAGPLRQPLAAGFALADAFILIGDDHKNIIPSLPADKPLFRAALTVPAEFQPVPAARYTAFCGLGRPEKFKKSLTDQGLSIESWHEFPDHYPYKPADIEALEAEARAHGRRLITTAKDAVRLPPGYDVTVPLDILPIALAWEDETSLRTFLINKIKNNA